MDAHSNERRPATLGTVNISNSQESSACPRRYAAAARVGTSPPIKPTVLFDASVEKPGDGSDETEKTNLRNQLRNQSVVDDENDCAGDKDT